MIKNKIYFYIFNFLTVSSFGLLWYSTIHQYPPPSATLIFGTFNRVPAVSVTEIWIILSVLAFSLFTVLGMFSIYKKDVNYALISLFCLAIYISSNKSTKSIPYSSNIEDLTQYLPFLIASLVYLEGILRLGTTSGRTNAENYLNRELKRIEHDPFLLTHLSSLRDVQNLILNENHYGSKFIKEMKNFFLPISKFLFFGGVVLFIVSAQEIIRIDIQKLLQQGAFGIQKEFNYLLYNALALSLSLLSILFLGKLAIRIYDSYVVGMLEKRLLIKYTLNDFIEKNKIPPMDELLFSEKKILENPISNILGVPAYLFWFFLGTSSVAFLVQDFSMIKKDVLKLIENNPNYMEPETFFTQLNSGFINLEKTLDEFSKTDLNILFTNIDKLLRGGSGG